MKLLTTRFRGYPDGVTDEEMRVWCERMGVPTPQGAEPGGHDWWLTWAEESGSWANNTYTTYGEGFPKWTTKKTGKKGEQVLWSGTITFPQPKYNFYISNWPVETSDGLITEKSDE